MKSRIGTYAVATLVCMLAPSLALAHTGAGGTTSFFHGFGHPITGLDHVLAMVMVGVLAYELGGRALWLVPVTFVAVMALGGALGVAGVGVPFVELGIALSVVVLGAVVALGIRASAGVAMGLVAFFAIFHGHAHGAEMPAGAVGLAYGVGFMIATGLLHLAGLAIGMGIGLAGRRYGQVVARSAAGLVAVAGAGILTGMI